MEQLKIDLVKTDINAYYQAGPDPEIRDLDAYYYLTIEGKSAPEAQSFTNAIESIYAIAYGVKFLCKAEDNDFTVPKMECTWFIDGGLEMQHQFFNSARDEWRWKIAIRMPDMVESDHFFRAMQNARIRKAHLDQTLLRVKFELINEADVCRYSIAAPTKTNGRHLISCLHSSPQMA